MNRNYREVNRIAEKTNDFVNPYNFVALPEKCNKSIDAFENLNKGQYTGTISCELETLTPLFIPNTTSSKAFPFAGKSFDFFSYEDLSDIQDCTKHFAKPIIPGSSIRGAIRSAYEAVTNSCLSTCDNENIVLHRRTTVPKTNYGILAKSGTGYVLYDAEKVMLNTAVYHGKTHSCGVAVARTDYAIDVGGVDKSTGDTVYIEYKSPGSVPFKTHNDYITKLYGVLGISTATRVGYVPGILFLGERFQNKHHDAVFVKRGSSIAVTQNDFDRFFKVWNQYQIDSPGSYPGYITLQEIPVYYGSVGKTLYITPACVSKEVFDAKINILLRDHKPCTSAKGKICPACALFGLISDSIDGTLASRVMFGDAEAIDFDDNDPKKFYEDPRQLPILGSPKISSTEFYTEDNTEKYKVWNYDYGILQQNGQPEPFSPKLRGRKFYWHKKELTPQGTNDRADLTAKVRAVKPGNSFRFNIAFDRLMKDELDTLLWTLTFGEITSAPEPNNAHKLGHGKPVGYGSVRYKVQNTIVYTLTDSLSLEPSEYTADYDNVKAAKKVASDYMKLTSYMGAPENVSYPNGIKGRDSGVYQWFAMNKGKMNNPEFNQVLASPTEIMPDNSTAATNKPFEEALRRNDEAEHVPQGAKKTKYYNSSLKIAQDQNKNDKRRKKLLDDFIADYEADPEYYKDLKGRYESIKQSYKIK